MGTRPAKASIPSVGDVQNTPVIHTVALHCIFFDSNRFLTVGVFLKNHSWKPYNAIDNT